MTTDERGEADRGDDSERPDPGPVPAAVVVEFDLTPEEWIEVAVEHNRGSTTYRKAVRDGRRALGLLVAMVAALGFLGGYPVFALAWLFAGGTATVLLPRSYERSVRKQYERFARDGIANGMFGTHRVHLTHEGLLDQTDAYERLTRWHAIERVVDGPGSFLVYMGRNAFLPIPHSAFRDSAELRAFADRFFAGVAAPRREPARGDLTGSAASGPEGGEDGTPE